jgi:hypothetical protein
MPWSLIVIQYFIKTGSGIQNLTGGNTQTHREQGDLISLLLFLAYFPYFEKKQSMVMTSRCCVCVCVCVTPYRLYATAL